MDETRKIFCRVCNSRFIPAPEGATPETRYVCASCSPLPPEIDHFQAYQFEPAMNGMNWNECDAAAAIGDLAAEVASRVSLRVIKARNDGESWAKNATPERVAALPKKQRIALLLVEWCDLTRAQAAAVLRDDYNHVNRNLVHAKASLATNPHIHTTNI